MNKVLAAAIRFLNGVIAIILVIVGAVVGAAFPQGSPIYALIGAIVGFVVALLACGLLALFIEIRTELIKIREVLESK
jgi:membrane associated rhomboid family serine protease